MQNLARFHTTKNFDHDYLERVNISKIGKISDRERFLPRSVKQAQ